MFSAKMTQKSILFSLLVLFITSQVSAKKCYFCYSLIDKDCESKPKQEKFEFECKWFDREGMLFNNPGLDSSLTADNEDAELDQLEPKGITFQCATATYTNITSGEKSLARGCVAKHINDESLKVLSLTGAHIQTDKIRRCNNELCNSK